MVTSDRRKWLALALLSTVQFMVVLDIAIVNVALPSIKVDLGFSQANLQWVISAYALVFGNVPVGTAALVLAPLLLRESRDAHVKRFDVPGAVLVTGGLSSVVYAITQAGQEGWLAGRTVGFFAASVALLAGFVAWERRHAEPLMRFGILRTRTLSGANVAGLILGTATFAMFLMLTLYMQQ